jgi:crotonobetainyl-CoA hydratase
MRGLDEPDLASALANQARYPAFGTWFNSADAAEGPRAFASARRNGRGGRLPVSVS